MTSRPTIDDFLIDEDNEDKFWSHGLSARQVRQVLDRPFLVKRNRKGRRAQYLVIGRDAHQRCIAIPIERTYDPGLWRPVTAWPCKASEEASLRQAAGS